MEIDILRGELERLFSLEEMGTLSKMVLGLTPDEIGGDTATASFARALVERSRADDSLDALADAVVALRGEVDPKVREATVHGFPVADELPAGAKLGDFTITRKIGEGPLAHTYQARRGEADVVLRVLRSEVSHDVRRVRRYLTQARLVASIAHPSLPSGAFAEIVEGRPVLGYTFFEAQPLGARVGRSGPMHLNEARPLLKSRPV
ncbi:MAG: hypothetical protein EOO75_14205 [Myxococcales bacterium]|nr:MAG: hypothetical protein EOO75_14205 [Myxococcales bacterium]